MPTWLVHGFRWPRPLIRIHIILQNLDDAAAEWLMAPPTVNAILANFHTLYPEPMANLASLRFIEQYDTEDMTTKDQPYAYVCDQVHEVRLGLDIDDVRGKGVANEAWTALADLRDKIAPGEKIGWFVVVNGDVERWAPAEENTDAMNDTAFKGSTDESLVSPVSVRSSMSRGDDREDKEPRGLKKWFKARRIKRLVNATCWACYGWYIDVV
jgi:hypothetical protein